jgi:putative ABC transport system permease protein
MIRHLLKLVWHRKRSTALLMLEVAVSFLVVFAVAAFALRYADNVRRPLGFDWQPVWVVAVDSNFTGDDGATEEHSRRMQQLLAEARGLSRVEAAAGAAMVPYEFAGMQSDVDYQKRSPMTAIDEVTDDFDEVMGLRLVAGRFFGPEDDGAAREPVVINRHLASALFDDADPLGKVIRQEDTELRVVGLVEDFRQDGELSTPASYMLRRTRTAGAGRRIPPRRLVLRMAPGTPASYEQEILRRLAPVAPGFSLEVAPLAVARHTRERFQLAPLVVGGVVAGFLLLMVALGLLGVLWQNVTRRTRELGLRRAAGASRAAVHRQVLLELVLITSLAVLPALLLVLQLPLLSSLGLRLAPGVVAAAAATSMLVVYGLAVVCGLYPSRIATRLAPAEALRWE